MREKFVSPPSCLESEKLTAGAGASLQSRGPDHRLVSKARKSDSLSRNTGGRVELGLSQFETSLPAAYAITAACFHCSRVLKRYLGSRPMDGAPARGPLPTCPDNRRVRRLDQEDKYSLIRRYKKRSFVRHWLSSATSSFLFQAFQASFFFSTTYFTFIFNSFNMLLSTLFASSLALVATALPTEKREWSVIHR